MNTRISFRSAAAAAMMATLLAASPASALPLSPTAVTCRTAVGKAFSSLMKTATQTIAGCHKARDKGDTSLTGTNCNDITAADAAKHKYAAAVTKQVAAINAACPASLNPLITALNYAGGKQYYQSCPVTCPGVPNPIVSMSEMATCMGCLAGSLAGDVTDATLGLPAQGSQSADNQKCRGALAKGFTKYLLGALKSETGCQAGADAAGHNDLASCTDYDPKSKVSGSLTKAKTGLDTSCAAANVATMDGCAADLTTLKTCTADEWSSAENQMFTDIYELGLTLCPHVIRTTVQGGCSTHGTAHGSCNTGYQTGTRLSVGWKGLGHNLDVTDNYTLAGDVTCPGTDKGSCGVCTIDGVSLDNEQYHAFTRCVDDPSQECTHPFSTDPMCGQVCTGGMSPPNTMCASNTDCTGADICSPGACKYFLGPPLAVNAGGTPTCTLNVVNSDITGTVDPDAGASQLDIDLRSLVHLGITQNHPCPICRNDTTPLDGNAQGKCLGGPRDGLACDVQGFDLSFAPTFECVGGSAPGTICQVDSDCAGGGTCVQTADDPHDGNSLDCPPNPGANISGSGLAIDLPLGTGTFTKSAQDNCDAPNASLSCFCGACDADTTVSCQTDSDCSIHGLGTCGQGSGVARLPNGCTDLTCDAVMGQTDRGICGGMAPDIDNYCDGLLFANGHGIVTCTSNGTCDSLVTGSMNPSDWICPGDNCGTCSYQDYRSCFMDPISISGTPDTKNPILAGTFCLPPSSNGSVNSATGSPGPGTVQTDSLVETRY